MLIRPEACRGCPLDPIATGFMEPRGKGFYGVMIIGEALGEEEAKSGVPFVGRAGKQLQECIDWAGLDIDGFIIANTVWCRPPNNKLAGESYELGAVAHCFKHHLQPLINSVQPKVIVTLGSVATRALLGLDQILKVRGYVYRWQGRLVLPSVHPSFIQRGQTKWIQVLVHDLQRAVEIAKDGYHPCTPHYLLDPGPEHAATAVEAMIASGNPIAYDIETPGKGEEEDENGDRPDAKPKPIIRIGFSAGEYTGLSIPFSRKYHPVIRRALSSESTKIVWNAAFDNPRLYAKGFSINGTIHDGMVAWHILHSDLPKGLGFVATMVCPEQPPWKHLSNELPAYYNATDADVEYRATHRIFDLLRQTGLWGVYSRHVLKVDKIFAVMSRAGMPIDPVVRLASAARLTALLGAIDAQIQAVVPKEVFPHHPKGGYKKLTPAEGDNPDSWICLPSGLWARRKPFVPSAGPHGGLTRYQDFLKHIPVTVQGKRTTDEVAIQRLMLRYPEDELYPLILKRQEVVKLGGTYVGWLTDGSITGGIRTDRENRVHTQYTHTPSTLRTASIAPNLQNIPRAVGLAAIVKAMFVAPPGYIFGELDYAAIEALLVGHFARSERYMRLARLGIHDFVNAHALNQLDGILTPGDLPDLSWSDADLSRYFAELKARFPEERQVRKRMVHARNYLVGWKEVQQVLIKEQGKVIPAKEIKRFLKFYDDLFPEIGVWQKELYETVGGVGSRTEDRDRGSEGVGRYTPIYGAAGPGWVRNPYGYLHRYNRAVTWERIGNLWQPRPGEDAKRLIAFLPQSTAAAIIKEALLRASEDPEILACLRLLIHDSLLLEMPESRAHDIINRLAAIMAMPNPELGGLRVGVEAKVGRSWDCLK